MIDYKKEAMSQIEQAIEEKVDSGLYERDAVYAVKRDLVQIKKPLDATGHFKAAIDAMQKANNSTLDEAMYALKLAVLDKYKV